MLRDDAFTQCYDIQFHQVDSMKVVHHSQYIFFLEEARFAFADKVLGMGYNTLVNNEIALPVSKINCRYVCSLIYGDTAKVYLKINNSISNIIEFYYEIRRQDGNVALLATTQHVFVNGDRKLIIQEPEIWKNGKMRLMEQNPQYIITDYERNRFKKRGII